MFPTLPTNPVEFFAWLASALAAGFVVSYLLERQPWFQALRPGSKSALIFWTFIALPFVSQAGLFLLAAATPPTDGPAWFTWGIAQALQGLTAWGASQYAHGGDPARKLKK